MDIYEDVKCSYCERKESEYNQMEYWRYSEKFSCYRCYEKARKEELELVSIRMFK